MKGRPLLLALVLVVAQCVVLYWPSPTVPGAADVPGLDKILHVAIFALPTWALVRAVRTPWVGVLAMVVHVPVSEWVQQALVPGRGAELWDGVAGLLGIVIGWAAGARTRAARDPRQQPASPGRSA